MTIEDETNVSFKYLYQISSRREYKEVCALEMKSIFTNTTEDFYHLSNTDIDINRSVFLKGRISIMYMEDSIEELEQAMMKDNLHYEDYYIHYFKIEEIDYKTRLLALRTLGFTIEGKFAITRPEVEFVLTKVNSQWVFGLLENNKNEWINRRQKPIEYSHAIEVKLAKSLINIAIGNDFSKKLVDPCSGIGTVVIEALAMGVNIKGFEINPLVAYNSRINIEHFGFNPDVTKLDMHDIDEYFDVAILDLPYGLYSKITKQEQKDLIRKSNEIADKAIIVSMEDMSEMYEDLNLEVVEVCVIEKSNAFKRYLTITKQKQS